MNSIDDYVLGPRTIRGRQFAESFATGRIIPYDPGAYTRCPVVYRGRVLYARKDLPDLERFMELLQVREDTLRHRSKITVIDSLSVIAEK